MENKTVEKTVQEQLTENRKNAEKKVNVAMNFLSNYGIGIVTGTCALAIQEVPLKREPGDVDVVFCVDKNKDWVLKVFAGMQHADGLPIYPGQTSVFGFYVFNHSTNERVKVNVFLTDMENIRNIPHVEYHGQSYTAVYYTLVQKTNLKRDKDHQDTVEIVNEILELIRR